VHVRACVGETVGMRESHSLRSSSISRTFWQPVAGFEMLNCTQGGALVSQNSTRHVIWCCSSRLQLCPHTQRPDGTICTTETLPPPPLLINFPPLPATGGKIHRQPRASCCTMRAALVESRSQPCSTPCKICRGRHKAACSWRADTFQDVTLHAHHRWAETNPGKVSRPLPRHKHTDAHDTMLHLVSTAAGEKAAILVHEYTTPTSPVLPHAECHPFRR
jgi:hypothetical protein